MCTLVHTCPNVAQRGFACPYMSRRVHTCSNMSQHVPTCPNMSQHVPTCPRMSPHVPTCPHVSPHVFPQPAPTSIPPSQSPYPTGYQRAMSIPDEARKRWEEQSQTGMGAAAPASESLTHPQMAPHLSNSSLQRGSAERLQQAVINLEAMPKSPNR